MAKSNKNSLINSVLFTVVALCFLSVFYFLNKKQILDVSSMYLSDICSQKTESINDLLQGYINTIDTTSYYYQMFVSRQKPFDIELLKRFEENFRFAKIIFVSKQGTAFSTTGQTFDSKDRIYMKEGLAGKHGYCYIQKEVVKGYSRLAFYAPIRIEKKIEGVIVGFLTPEQAKDIFEVSTFGYRSQYCLCQAKDDHFHCLIHERKECNAAKIFYEKRQTQKAKYEQIVRGLKEGKGQTYIYKDAKDTKVCYLSALVASDFILLQTTSSNAGRSLAGKISLPSYMLIFSLVIFFIAYLLYVFHNYNKTKRQVQLQNKRNFYLSHGSNYLKEKFILVDLEKSTYEYLTLWQDTKIPQKGRYEELTSLICGEQATQKEKQVLSSLLEKDAIEKRLSKEEQHFEFLSHTQTKKQEQWSSGAVICVEKHNKKPSVVLLSMVDVTTMKVQEKKDRKTIEDALFSAQLASRAKSDFLSRMSHDIRTPLNAIMGMSRIALMYRGNEERVMNCIDNIQKSAKHLTGLVNAVLDMSKIEHGKMELLNENFALCDMSDDILAIILPQMQANDLKFSMRVFGIEDEYLKGDMQRLEQTVINIVGNAVKFTPKGGNISLTIEQVNTTLKNHCKLQITCCDSGIGMKKQEVEHIFEPFFRANNSVGNKVEGSGLGMTIAKNIAAMMKGDLVVHSKEKKGTTVTLTVQLEIASSSLQDMDFLKDKKVLVISPCSKEHDSAFCFLEKHNISVCHANTFDLPNERYDVVLATQEKVTKDIAKKITLLKKQMQAPLILAAYTWQKDLYPISCLDCFIQKPLFNSKLLKAMKEIFEKKNAKKENEKDGLCADYSAKHILLAEDNDLNREIAVEFLSTTKVQIDRAEDGKQALDMFKKSAPYHYDLILMDIQMPNMTGYEATRAIRECKRSDAKIVPIVAMTADAFAEDVRLALDEGMNDHIAKPLDVEKLMKVLKRYLA